MEEATPRGGRSCCAPSGKTIRADFTRVEAVEGERLHWRQELAGSPFERILASALTRIELSPAGEGDTRVVIELDQQPRGWARLAPLQFRTAAARQAQGEAEGLDVLFGEPEP